MAPGRNGRQAGPAPQDLAAERPGQHRMRPTVSDALLDAIDALADRRLAPTGRDHAQGGDLAAAVREVSETYTRKREALPTHLPDARALEARLRFFLPRDLPKLWGPLSELDRTGAMPPGEALHVLDVGCGLGTTSLGAALYFDATAGHRALHVTALDRDRQALSLMEQLLSATGRTLHAPIDLLTRCSDLRNERLPRRDGGYDLILAGLVFNEIAEGATTADAQLERGRELLDSLAARLAPTGAIIVIEPALRTQARMLQRLRDEVAAAQSPLHVFAPCTHAKPCPLLARKRDWCHERQPDALPKRLRPIAAQAGLRDEGLTYSYLTLTRRARNIGELAQTNDGDGRSPRALRGVSGPLTSKGKVELDVCGEGGLQRLMQLQRKPVAPEEDLTLLGRGTVLSLAEEAGQPPSVQAPRRRLQGGELRVHQAWSAQPSVIDTLPERAR